MKQLCANFRIKKVFLTVSIMNNSIHSNTDVKNVHKNLKNVNIDSSFILFSNQSAI
jgi:hypothetical protein